MILDVINDTKLFKKLIVLNYLDFVHLNENLEYNSLKEKNRNYLFIYLFYLKHYLTLELINWIFKIDISKLYRKITKYQLLLYRYSYKHFYFLEEKERIKNGAYFHSFLITVIGDGVEQQIIDPDCKHLEYLLHSEKKNKKTLTKLIWVTPTGIILHLGFSFIGSMNDISLINIRNEQIHEKLTKNEFILLDLGFIGTSKISEQYKTGFKGKLNENQKEFNNQISQIRIVVEMIINQVKKWKICSSKLRSKILSLETDNIIENHHMNWIICSFLTNQYKLIPKNGLRSFI